ncbi:MAG: HEPN domain-containing protein [Oscillospiraceae bacterium]|nr:HEPN domain-containing protein [Oscillospiraceae bacterium]
MNSKAQYWLDLADYDLETAQAMLKTKRYLYVGFMCHQTIEKALKAVIAKDCADGDTPPKIHDLTKLSVRANMLEAMSDEQQDFIEKLNPLNIQARYPEHKERLAMALDKGICQDLISSTEDFLCWIKEQLSTR